MPAVACSGSGGNSKAFGRVGLSLPVHHLSGFQTVKFAGHMFGQRGRHIVKNDAALRHTDQSVAISAGKIERMEIAHHGDAEMLVDAQK